MSSESEATPRIHIVFAAASRKAVILRRGPTRWVQLMLWHTDTDVVEAGSWFRGRIYEDGCSLSPDGRLFAYQARKPGGRKSRGVDDVWTAISKPPWLTAIALWPHPDTWSGRAVFVDNLTLVIDCAHWERLKTNDALPRNFSVIPRWIGKGAPEQELPEPPNAIGKFVDGYGVDVSGRSFRYEDGRLLRGDHIIVDLNPLSPDPQPSPDWAHEW